MKKLKLHLLIVLSFIGFKIKLFGFKIENYFQQKALIYAHTSGQIPTNPEVNNPINPKTD